MNTSVAGLYPEANSWQPTFDCPVCHNHLQRASEVEPMELAYLPDGADYQICPECDWESDITYDI